MPVKDLTGRRRRTKAESALLAELHKRMGKPWPPRRGPRDEDGPEPAIAPRGPKPTPLSGGATIDEHA